MYSRMMAEPGSVRKGGGRRDDADSLEREEVMMRAAVPA